MAPSIFFKCTAGLVDMSYTLTRPSQPAVTFHKSAFSPEDILPFKRRRELTRNFPVGSQLAERTVLVLSDRKETLVGSCKSTILTNRSLFLRQFTHYHEALQRHCRSGPQGGSARSTHSLHTATRAPCLSTLTHRIGTAVARVRYPAN